MSKVAIYCRLSDEDRDKRNSSDDSESIQNQKNLLMKYAFEKGWDIYKIYSDDDYSGLDTNRPEFNEMIRDAENRKFDIILCKTQSRFTRDMELVEKYLHNKFIGWSIRFVTAVDGVDTLDKNNKKSRQINGLVNEWYCEDISESIKAVFRLKQQQGKFIGSFAPYGYAKDPNDKSRLVINEEAADVIKLIYNLYLQGFGTQKIASILNEKGILNPTQYKRQNGLNYTNANSKNNYYFWNKTTVKRILKNDVYIGNMIQHKRSKLSYKNKQIKSLPSHKWLRVCNTHDAIIDKETYELVQKRLESNVKSTGLGQAYMFAGKVKCLDCKNNMNKTSNGSGYSYLRCKLYIVSPKKRLCTSHSIRVESLEKIVFYRIKEYVNKFCNENKIAHELALNQVAHSKLAAFQKELKRIDKDILNRGEALKNLYLDKVKGIITEDQFNEFNVSFSTEKEGLQAKKVEIEKNIDYIIKNQAAVERYIEIVNKYKNFTELNHRMVSEFIDYIEIGEKDKKTSEQEIIIHWNF